MNTHYGKARFANYEWATKKYHFYTTEPSKQGGVMIIVMKSLDPTRVDAHRNRYLCIRIRWLHQTIDIHGMYSKQKQKTMCFPLARINASVEKHPNYKFVVAGDLNEECRPMKKRLEKYSNVLMSDNKPTRWPRGNQKGKPSCLDMIATRTTGNAQFKQSFEEQYKSDHALLTAFIYFPP